MFKYLLKQFFCSWNISPSIFPSSCSWCWAFDPKIHNWLEESFPNDLISKDLLQGLFVFFSSSGFYTFLWLMWNNPVQYILELSQTRRTFWWHLPGPHNIIQVQVQIQVRIISSRSRSRSRGPHNIIFPPSSMIICQVFSVIVILKHGCCHLFNVIMVNIINNPIYMFMYNVSLKCHRCGEHFDGISPLSA